MLTDVQSLSCRLVALLVVAAVVLHPLLLPVEANIIQSIEFQGQTPEIRLVWVKSIFMKENDIKSHFGKSLLQVTFESHFFASLFCKSLLKVASESCLQKSPLTGRWT